MSSRCLTIPILGFLGLACLPAPVTAQPGARNGEWRTYAPVLAVGFACGMALMGMASISIALIQKSVSVLIF